MSAATLPQGTPLMAKTPKAAEIFDISPRQLRNLRSAHKEVAALTVRVGRDMYYDVPAMYEWFRESLGGEIEAK